MERIRRAISMKETDDALRFDPSDLAGMKQLMDKFSESVTIFSGENEAGETVYISICHSRIVVRTLQENHWIRLNVYYRDGSCDETFDGKWG